MGSANAAGSLVAEDVGVEAAHAVGRQERGDEGKRPDDQNDRVVNITRGHDNVAGPTGSWRPPHPGKCRVSSHSSGNTGVMCVWGRR